MQGQEHHSDPEDEIDEGPHPRGGMRAPGGAQGAGSSVLAASAAAAKAWTLTLGRTGATVAWVVGTTVLVLVFPLWLEAEREADLIRLEQEQVQSLQSQGYSPTQIQQMQMNGQLGVPPPPPPLAPYFP